MRTVYALLAALALGATACGGGITRPGSGGDGGGDAAGIDAAPPTCVDEDHDGYGEGCTSGPDCNDHDRSIHPGAPEMCDDGVDNNCDGQTDEDPCVCHYGAVRECYSGPDGTAGVGECKRGLRHCDDTGAYGDCLGEVTPTSEVCDGKDNDCNGLTDDGVTNVCGTCGPVPAEVCGDGLDNNCNGTIDENCGSCDPGCQCAAGICTCHPPTNQPCYGGPPRTAGVGLCTSGLHDCELQADGSYRWGACRGQVLPAAPVCDGQDHDCDGQPDDGVGCTCTDGAVRACGSDVGECRKGTQLCAGGVWGDCNNSVDPTPEICDGLDNDCDGFTDNGVLNACGGCGPVPDEVCGDGLDNNCDGQVDEGCACSPGDQQSCYRGSQATQHRGTCMDGVQECAYNELGSTWGPCLYDVLPVPEVCGDRLDNDCDGQTDNGCNCPEGDTRVCGSDVGECRTGTRTCTNGQWGACLGSVDPTAETCDGKDNNCNGLTDEGVLNACGKCPPEPCYVVDYGTPGDCVSQPGRTCDSVVPDPTDPNAITLSESTNTIYPYIYIAVTGKNEVALLNTDTPVGQNAKLWQVPSYGVAPSRTAVALDGTVWVGNRCLIAGSENDLTCSNMIHLDLNGNLICRADIPGWVRGVAIDADSNVWAGTYNGHTVWKVHPSAVDNTQSPPRCQILGSLDVTDPVYGLAIDGSGYLWTSWNPTRKVDTHTIQLADTPVAHNYWYGIAVDGANHVWFGGWSGSGDMHRVDGDPPHNILSTGATGVTAVTVHPDGTVWGSRYGAPFGVEKITLSADGATVVSAQNFVDPCADPSYTCENHGVAVDHVGKIWSSQRFAGRVNRWLTDGTHEGLFDVDPGYELYTYSDMTGIQLRTFTIHEGHWLQTFDSGYLTPIWDHVEWTAVEPLGTAVSVQIRAADHEADFAAGTATAWCGPFTASPGVLQPACAVLNGHRWVQVDVKLSTTANGVKPTVSDVKVAWSY